MDWEFLGKVAGIFTFFGGVFWAMIKLIYGDVREAGRTNSAKCEMLAASQNSIAQTLAISREDISSLKETIAGLKGEMKVMVNNDNMALEKLNGLANNLSGNYITRAEVQSMFGRLETKLDQVLSR